MRKIFFATGNKGKVTTFRNTMSKYGIDVEQVPMEIPEPRSDEVREIAREKAAYAFRKIGKPCIALDAGFYIDSLNGFPKAFVNFALNTIGVEGMLKLLNGRSRGCEFRHCIAYMDSRLKEPECFEAHVRGTMARAKKGVLKSFNWSKLSLVFVPEGEKRTLAQMSESEYYSWRTASKAEKYEDDFAKFLLKRR
jgi:XTP/dITP diphosphohydrolase